MHGICYRPPSAITIAMYMQLWGSAELVAHVLPNPASLRATPWVSAAEVSSSSIVVEIDQATVRFRFQFQIFLCYRLRVAQDTPQGLKVVLNWAISCPSKSQP